MLELYYLLVVDTIKLYINVYPLDLDKVVRDHVDINEDVGRGGTNDHISNNNNDINYDLHES